MKHLRASAALLAALAPSTVFVTAVCGNGPHSLVPPFTDEHSADVCKQCTTSEGCQWCPLSQSCGSKRSFGRSAKCLGSRDQDKAVDSGADCAAPKPAWMKLLEERYGSQLEKADSDVMRCLQGRVERWTVWPEAEKTGRSIKQISEYSCMSAVVREAVLLSLGPTIPQVLLVNSTSSGVQEELLARRRLKKEKDEDIWEVVHSPVFCQAFAELVPDEECQAFSYGAAAFGLLQKLAAGGAGPPDLKADIMKSIRSGPLRPHEDFEEDFHTTWDRKYTLHVGFKDVKNLQKLLTGQPKRAGASPLGQYLNSNKYSLLQRVYGLVSFKILDESKYCLLMANEAHGLEKRAQSFHAALIRYDLKGKSRSQKKKQKSSTRQVLLNGDFKERENNKLPLKNWHCKELKKVLKKDVAFLVAHGMAEYSLFVEIATGRGDAAVTCTSLPGAPLCTHHEQLVRTSAFSIIDYFDDTVMDKSSLRFGSQMMEFVNEVCITNKKESLDSWQIWLILICVAAVIVGVSYGCWKFGLDFIRSTQPHELRSADPSVEMTMRNPGMAPAAAGWPGAAYPAAGGYPGGHPAAFPAAYPAAAYPAGYPAGHSGY